jgi:hypothetical protein
MIRTTGEVSHFQALATALSATVGLGNIAGVAIAVSHRRSGRDVLDDRRRLLGMTSSSPSARSASSIARCAPTAA